MTSNIPALRHSGVALAAAGALVGALATSIGSAAAQTTYVTTEQMTIIAPGVHHRTVGRGDTGIPVEELLLSRAIDISDLDLSRWSDVQALDYRVRQTAFATCNELERAYPQTLYPFYQSSGLSCVRQATEDGMAQARLAVAQRNGYGPFPQ